MTAADCILWYVYAGALVARKLVKYSDTTRTLAWRRHLVGVRNELATRGYCL